ncbi:MAG: hypothetical protein COB78_09610 [Hyphomicrobiales bacterium]|nr:MAG: hypothetical protein COB78_09610 [Hyphomicrobiales bacterium]
MNLTRNLCAMIALLVVGFSVGGCVSSTLNSAQQSEVENNKELSYDPVAREQAVTEMRARVEKLNTQKSDVFASQEGLNRPLTASEADAKIRALNASTAELGTQNSDDEMEAKQRSIAELRRKAKNHYSDALRKIEN